MTENLKLLYQVCYLDCFWWIINCFLGPFTFTIGDTRNFGVYEGGGSVTEVKKPETVHFVREFYCCIISYDSKLTF